MAARLQLQHDLGSLAVCRWACLRAAHRACSESHEHTVWTHTRALPILAQGLRSGQACKPRQDQLFTSPAPCSLLCRQGLCRPTPRPPRPHKACVQCRLMAFSPNERYLVTHSIVEPETPQDKATMVLNLFDVRLGRCMRNFTGPADEFAVGAAAGAWPIFKWAGHPEDKCAPD